MSDQNLIPGTGHIKGETSSPLQSDFMSGIIYLEAEPTPVVAAEGGRTPTGTSIIDPTSIVNNGRTYHNYDTSYLLPNDGDEQDRLDMQHHIIKLLLDGKFGLAPVDNPRYALDIATGTGLWAIEFAEQHPNCNVVGTDLSKIQPNGLVPNCTFEKEDSEKQEWVFPNMFDYIHLRMVATCFDDTKTVIARAFKHLQPGGWLEFQDVVLITESFDGTNEGTAFTQTIIHVNQAGASLGRDFCKARLYEQWLIKASFKDVVCVQIPWPVGAWPVDPKFKQIGRYTILDFDASLDSFKNLIKMGSGMTTEEVDNLIGQAKHDNRNTAIHTMMKFYVVYGRKPFDWELAPNDAGLGLALNRN